MEHVCHLSEQVLKLLQLALAHPADEFLVEVVKDARAGVGFVPSALGEADQAVLRGTAALPTHFRVSSGPGWALVGDAGHHKDPVIARGIADAVRDADLVASAVAAGWHGDLEMALDEYGRQRDRCAIPLSDANLGVARLTWPPPPRAQPGSR